MFSLGTILQIEIENGFVIRLPIDDCYSVSQEISKSLKIYGFLHPAAQLQGCECFEQVGWDVPCCGSVRVRKVNL